MCGKPCKSRVCEGCGYSDWTIVMRIGLYPICFIVKKSSMRADNKVDWIEMGL